MKNFLLLIFVLYNFACVYAQTITRNGLDFELSTNPNEAYVVGRASGSTATDIIIPSVVTDNNVQYFVRKIKPSAFENNQLTSVIIPNSVASIGKNAFKTNNLTSVTIPDSVSSISEAAFAFNQLTSVTMPDNLNTISALAFSRNQLTNITIPDSVTSIGTSAFSINQLTSLTIPTSVTSIDAEAFYGNLLESVTIPNSITSIGADVFYDNKLTSVTIPDSVTSIRPGAFKVNQLTSVNIPNIDASIDDTAFDEGVIIEREPTLSAEDFDLNTNENILFENPVGSVLDIFTQTSINSISIYNSTGQVVLKSNSIENLNVNGLQSGVYIIRFETDQGFISNRMIKK